MRSTLPTIVAWFVVDLQQNFRNGVHLGGLDVLDVAGVRTTPPVVFMTNDREINRLFDVLSEPKPSKPVAELGGAGDESRGKPDMPRSHTQTSFPWL